MPAVSNGRAERLGTCSGRCNRPACACFTGTPWRKTRIGVDIPFAYVQVYDREGKPGEHQRQTRAGGGGGEHRCRTVSAGSNGRRDPVIVPDSAAWAPVAESVSNPGAGALRLCEVGASPAASRISVARTEGACREGTFATTDALPPSHLVNCTSRRSARSRSTTQSVVRRSRRPPALPLAAPSGVVAERCWWAQVEGQAVAIHADLTQAVSSARTPLT